MKLLQIMGITLICAGVLVGVAAGQDKVIGVRAEMLKQFDDAVQKILQLADAMPQEVYDWRPAEGVRSTSEVLMHVCGANFFFPTLTGSKPSDMYKRGMENTVTQKEDVIKMLKQSIEYVNKGFASLNDADLDKEVDLFGTKTTYRGVYMLLVSHSHEHLGQSIAYARMNGVAPPWSRSEQ